MNSGHRRELDDAVGALRRDGDAVVPEGIEERLVSAFRAHQVMAALRDDDQIVVPPAVEARLLAAFREQHGRHPGRQGSLPRFPRYLARAAVLLAAMAGAVWFGMASQSGRSDAPRATAVADVSGPQPAARVRQPSTRTREVRTAPVKSDAGRGDPQTIPVPLPSRAMAAASVASSAPVVDDDTRGAGDDEFIPLEYADVLSGGATHVVGVDVPRSALLDFGAQADALPDDGAPVRAEVLMSEDGMPRGIRFVDRVPAPAGSRDPGRAPVPTRRRLQP